LVIGISVTAGKERELEWWSDGVLVLKSQRICKKIFNGISGVLSFGFSITPILQPSNTPGAINLLL